MEDAKREELLSDLKDRLRITWDNEKTNRELKRIINNAEAYMNHLLGAELDYTVPGIMNILYMEYCCYVWNNCPNEFEEAYQKDILRAHAICEVDAYEDENAGIE